ncbi:MAG: hypothetical protein RLZ75_1839 [Pseudomonadota bacterium]
MQFLKLGDPTHAINKGINEVLNLIVYTLQYGC